jgi:hypothetical protein
MSENGRNPGQGSGAMEEEMRISDLDSDMAAFESQIRDEFVRPPSTAVAEAHLTAMLAAAEAVATTDPLVPARPKRTRRNGWVVVRRLALVPLAVLVAGAGMAVAGVRPPEPISDLFERAGVDVPGSDEEGDDRGRGETPSEPAEPAEPADRGERSDQTGETAIETGERATNTSNDGPTPGAQRANENAAEGQRTAEQARSGQTPPDMPGHSEDHPTPQGSGTPPEDPGHQGHGEPDSPPGQSRSSTQSQGGGTDKEKPVKVKPDKKVSDA